MARGKKLGILLIVLVVICVAAVVVVQLTKNSDVAVEEDTSAEVLTLDSSEVTELSWSYTEDLSFLYDGENWSYAGDSTFPLDESYLNTILTDLSDLTAVKTIEDVEDFAQYGLFDPVCVVTVDGTTPVTLNIGNESTDGSYLYVSIGDGNVYMVDVALLDDFSYGLYDLIAAESLPDMSDVTSLVIDADTQYLEIDQMVNSGLAYSDSYTWFAVSDDGYTTLDNDLAESMIQIFTNLTWNSCVDYNATDLSQYGLDNPCATVTISYIQSSTVDTGETDEDGNAVTEAVESNETFVLELGDYADNAGYARIAGSNMVYLVDATVNDTALYTTAADLLPDEVLVMNWDNVSSVDITIDGDTHTLVKDTALVETEDTDSEDEDADTEDTEETEATYETIWTVDGQTVDGASIWDALDALESTGSGTGLSADRNEELRFLIHQDNENFPEVELIFYQYDSSNCLVSLNGDLRLFVDRSAIVDLEEQINEMFLDLN